MTTPLPGDFFVVRTNGWIADQIRALTNSTVNHAGIFVGQVIGLQGDQVLEAAPGGARYTPAANYAGAIWSTGRLPAEDTPAPAQRELLVWGAHKMLGTPYGFLDIVAIAFAQARLGSRVSVVKALRDQPWWVRRILSLKTMICSQLVDEIYTDAGLHLFDDGRLAQLVSPGDLLHLLLPETPAAAH